MRSTRPPVLDRDPVALTEMWDALAPEAGADTPRIRAVMISSVDGTTSVDGRSAGLATPTDRLLYDAMRARADLVMVGSGTALTEGYGPAVIKDPWRERRSAPAPEVLILSRSLSDRVIDHCVAAGPGLSIVAAPDSDPARIRIAGRRGVRVHTLAPGPLGENVHALASRLGAREVDFEGGPDLLATFLRAGAVDELVLSLSPEVIIGGDPSRLVTSGPHPACRVPMRIATAFTGPDGGLYTRWVVESTTGRTSGDAGRPGPDGVER